MTIGILPKVSFIRPKRVVNSAQNAQFRTGRLRNNLTKARRRTDLRKKPKDKSDAPAETRGNLPRISFSSKKRKKLDSIRLPMSGFETVRASKIPTTVTVMLLEGTLAVLSLGKLCQDHGYSYEWTSGQKPQLIKDGRKIECNTANCAPFVVPGLSKSSSTSSSPTSPNIFIAGSRNSHGASRINEK